jgi:hypothetical protein
VPPDPKREWKRVNVEPPPPREAGCGRSRAPLLERPFAAITKRELYHLLDAFIRDRHVYKAKVTHSWLETLFRWAAKRDFMEASVMEAVDIEIEKRQRTRKGGAAPVYSDAEVAACWRAADQLTPVEGAYV